MSAPDDRPPAGEYALLGLLALLWGSSYLFAKVAVSEIPPLTVVAARVSIAALLLLAVASARREAWPRGGRIWGMLLVQAVFNSIGAWSILAWSQRHIDAALASVLNSTAPIFVFFMTLAITRHEATSWRRFAGALLGLAGVVLIVGLDAAGGLDAGVWGAAGALFSAFLHGCAAIYGRRFSDLSPAATAAGTMVWASLVLVPAALAFERPWTLRPSVEALAALAVLGVFCTGAALLLYFRLIRTLGSLGVASQAYLRAGVGAGLGVMILGERLTAETLLGVGLALLGVACINLPAKAGRRPRGQ